MNQHKPHIYILPEDHADERIANGFIGEVPQVSAVAVVRSAGSWNKVVNEFTTVDGAIILIALQRE